MDQVGREGAVSTTTSWVDRVGEGTLSQSVSPADSFVIHDHRGKGWIRGISG